jgi:acyl carrier protein
MSLSIKQWLINWFIEQNDGTLPLKIENIEDQNFFELQLIDSLGIIMLVEEIETKYSISLNQDHFEQRRFSTIKGLSEIITEEMSNNGSL